MLNHSAWTGQVCVGSACFSAAEHVRALRLFHGRPNATINVPCGASSTRKSCTIPLALDPWQECGVTANSTSRAAHGRPRCLFPNKTCKPANEVRSISCSTSLGEESFALIALLRIGLMPYAEQPELIDALVRPADVRASFCAMGRMPQALYGGTFLEIGANNGFASNTRHLEFCLGWSGLLVEGHPKNIALLRKSRPNALILASAVCASHGSVGFSERGGVRQPDSNRFRTLLGPRA